MFAGAVLAAGCFAGCMEAPVAQGERAVVDGECPAVSPDGKKIAFHRYEDGVMKVGVVPAEGGAVTWIESGPAMAAYPAWTPDGDLVYTYGQEKGTAYEVYKRQAKPEGYGLRYRGADGRTREITTGYTRDYLPSLSPDGKTVYFATTREVKNPSNGYSSAMSANLARVPLDGSKPPEVILKPPYSCNSGMAQPVVSPDGRRIAWQHMGQFNPDNWCVFAARTDRLDLDHAAMVTPKRMTALAPRWHPSGRYLAFTGFMPEDPGWGVWLMDLSNFAMRRIADGENPSFSPDGKWVAYDRDRKTYRRPLTAADMPTPADVVADDDESQRFPPERVVWSQTGTGKPMCTPVSGDDFALPADRAVFVRVKIVWNGKDPMQMYFRGEYGETDQGLLVYISDKNALWFASRNANGNFAGVSKVLTKAGTYDVIGVRTRGMYYLSINGQAPLLAGTGGNMSLVKPRQFKVGYGLKPGSAVEKVEFGTGWPKDIPTAAKARQEVFK